MKHGLVDGVGRFVGEDAGGQHGDQLGHFVDATIFHHVVVDQRVFAVEFHLNVHFDKDPLATNIRN